MTGYQIEVQVDGKSFLLKLKSLGEPIDSFIKKLLNQFFLVLRGPYQEFINKNFHDLKENIFLYLDGKINNPPGQDYLFNNLTIIGNNYLFNGRVSEAQQFWNDILNLVLDWEQSRNARVHKGSIYYFWSQIAILQGELDKGFFLIHSAYEEDVLTFHDQSPSTPTTKTLSLNYLDPGNLLFNLVKAWANYLENFISKYRINYGNRFTLDNFRNKFLTNPPSRDTLFSFTYNLAKLYNFDLLPKIIVNGNFASLYELDTLFNFVLVTDAVIYSQIQNPAKDDWKFINLANYLLIKSNISTDEILNKCHLQFVNSQKDVDFEKTINNLLNNSFVFSDGTVPSVSECDLMITYCLRNYSAHNINSFPIIRNRFLEIRQSILNSLFFAVEHS